MDINFDRRVDIMQATINDMTGIINRGVRFENVTWDARAAVFPPNDSLLLVHPEYGVLSIKAEKCTDAVALA